MLPTFCSDSLRYVRTVLVAALGALAGCAPTLPVSSLAVNARACSNESPDDAIDSIILQAMQNERDEGFNSNLPAPGGLYINWVYRDPPPPLLVNLNSRGVPDPDPSSRHDRLTDVEYMMDLALFAQRHPDDHQFDDDLARYTAIIQSEFAGHVDIRGWVYFLFKELGASDPDFAGYADEMADSYDRTFQSNYRRYGQAIPIHYSRPADDPTGTYRCDLALEAAAALIDNGAARGLSRYVQDGEDLLAFVQANCYSAALRIWAMEMGHLFTDASLSAISPPEEQTIHQGDMKAGAIAEIAEALCQAERADPGRGYGQLAQATLDRLTPDSSDPFGLWDPTYGGYYQGIVLTGTRIADVTGFTLAASYKEVGRMATMRRAFIECNRVLDNRYADAVAPVTQSILDSYYADGHGWPYQEHNNFSLYTGGGVVQNWVTSEATGHAIRALFDR